jgi:hypothetical protein
MPILVFIYYQSTVFKYFYPIISFFLSSIRYLKFWMYYLKNLYYIFVRFDIFRIFIRKPVVIPFISKVNREFAVTCNRNKLRVNIAY